MEEIFDKDDALGRLLREEGLLKTSPGFTTRVMHMVNDIPQKAEYSYKPLLSRGTWISIILGFLTLAVISLFAVASDKATEMTYIDRLKPAFSLLSEIHFSFRLAPGTIMLATIIMASAGLLLLLDYYLNNNLTKKPGV